MTKELKCNIKGFAERWETHGEAFAWEVLRYGCIGHSPPWHIVNGTTWVGPLDVSRKKDRRLNESICKNEETGYQNLLSRGNRGSAPSKNKRCLACIEIILAEKDKINGQSLTNGVSG